MGQNANKAFTFYEKQNNEIINLDSIQPIEEVDHEEDVKFIYSDRKRCNSTSTAIENSTKNNENKKTSFNKRRFTEYTPSVKFDAAPLRKSAQSEEKSLNPIKLLSKKRKNNENLRTTLMLICVCVLFLLAEFPQCILIFLSIIMNEHFYNDVYLPLGDLMDIIALVNNSINFIIYCSMSRSFRDTFYNLFKNIFCKKLKKQSTSS
jgi:hypothetical protein